MHHSILFSIHLPKIFVLLITVRRGKELEQNLDEARKICDGNMLTLYYSPKCL